MLPYPSTTLAPNPTVGSGPFVHLLGGPYVTQAGRRIEVPESAKRLVAFVALRGGRVDRRCAAGTLWPENDEVRAAGNLRSTLWRLRGTGCDVLSADHASLWLRPGTSVDLERLHTWADRLAAGCPEPEDLGPAPWRMDLVELLPGIYDDWVLLERERVRQVLLHAFEALARHLAAQQRWAEAVSVATLTVAAEPLRETAQAVLIATHLAEGNLVEARRAFEAYSSLVRRELGVAPGAAVRALVGAWEPH